MPSSNLGVWAYFEVIIQLVECHLAKMDAEGSSPSDLSKLDKGWCTSGPASDLFGLSIWNLDTGDHEEWPSDHPASKPQ